MAKRSGSPIDPGLLKFCTPGQEKILAEVIRCGGVGNAAKKLDLSSGTVRGYVTRVELQAAKRGYSPQHDMTRVVPATHYLKGTSTLYVDGQESPKMQWVKSAADPDKMMAVAEGLAASFFADRKPLPKIPAPKQVSDDLLTVYVIADLHLGMYAWAEESGDDYDCDIAAQCLNDCMDQLVAKSPPSGQCIIAQLGDLLHMDDDSNQTRRSGNALDVDTRFPKVAELGLRLYRRTIDRALQRHDQVKVVNVPGNHDDVSAMWLGLAVKTAYENNERVEVDCSPGPYFYHRFGKNLLGFAHGHTCKMTRLGEVMVADRGEDISATEHRYWYTGHIHQDKKLDSGICSVESFRSLSAKDAWTHGAGYRAKRTMRAITLHRTDGEDSRLSQNVRSQPVKE